MQEQNNENTIPNPIKGESGSTAPTKITSDKILESAGPTIVLPTRPEKLPRPIRWPFILAGFILVLLFSAVGIYLGYYSALDLRKAQQEAQVVNTATEHFYLGLEAQKNQQFALARQHFEYVIQLDPNFPGAAEKLTEVMVAQMATTTPTVAPTLTPTVPTPTPDLRSQEEKFNQARSYYLSQDWDNLFVAIDALRTTDPTYRAVEVDGMLYFALRFRGIRKIYQEANLEGGMYDLALAEKIAPLDNEALAARNAARVYLNAIVFWGADWVKVINNLEQIYPSMPNLRDASGLTAIERYRQAVIAQASKLANQGDMCGAYEYYNKALSSFPDANMELTATAAYGICYPPTATMEPTLTPTITPTPENTVVVEFPSNTPELPTDQTPQPEETPTPTP